jgi:hypothetical protein
MSSYYDRFEREWLFETPLSTGPSGHDPYTDLVTAIKTNIQSGNIPDDVGDGLKKLEMGSQVTYWLDSNNTVEVIAQFEKKATGLYVELIGKRAGSTMYASKFYEMVLLDADRLIFSGDMLSNQGLGIWKQLFRDGKKLFVYDMSNSSNNKTIDSEQELQSYMNDKKYRFVLSESVKQHSLVTTSFDLLRTYNLTFNLGDRQ